MSEAKLYPVPAEWKARAYLDDAGYRAMYQRSVADPTAFWRLCDTADSIAPDALASRDEVPVPARDGDR